VFLAVQNSGRWTKSTEPMSLIVELTPMLLNECHKRLYVVVVVVVGGGGGSEIMSSLLENCCSSSTCTVCQRLCVVQRLFK
jgi:hypothetical protein